MFSAIENGLFVRRHVEGSLFSTSIFCNSKFRHLSFDFNFQYILPATLFPPKCFSVDYVVEVISFFTL